MANDPAFIFYPGDYFRDTQCLSANAQVAYDRIMCEHMRNICITQHQLNFFTKRLTEDERSELLMVLKKVSGGYIIEWVAESIKKRREYSESRRNNRIPKDKKVKTYVEHMENANEIEDINIIPIEKRKEAFKEQVFSFKENYSIDMLEAFNGYWSETNDGGKKMRKEMEKVFDISRRLITWKGNGEMFKKNGNGHSKQQGINIDLIQH